MIPSDIKEWLKTCSNEALSEFRALVHTRLDGEAKPALVDDCLFCKIARKEKKATIVATFEHCFVMLDDNPISKGHALIIPYSHAENWFAATPPMVRSIREAIDHMKAKWDLEHSPDGYNIGANCGHAAGQTIMHLHIHLIPRYQGDSDAPCNGGIRKVRS